MGLPVRRQQDRQDLISLALDQRYLDRIEEACMALATFPKRGTRRDDILPGLRTIGFERRVTIAFRVLKRLRPDCTRDFPAAKMSSVLVRAYPLLGG
jgi:plasmid stabilization system protein ParE